MRYFTVGFIGLLILIGCASTNQSEKTIKDIVDFNEIESIFIQGVDERGVVGEEQIKLITDVQIIQNFISYLTNDANEIIEVNNEEVISVNEKLNERGNYTIVFNIEEAVQNNDSENLFNMNLFSDGGLYYIMTINNEVNQYKAIENNHYENIKTILGINY